MSYLHAELRFHLCDVHQKVNMVLIEENYRGVARVFVKGIVEQANRTV